MSIIVLKCFKYDFKKINMKAFGILQNYKYKNVQNTQP